MGTRSTTLIREKDRNDKTGKITFRKLVKLYRQYDGYPDGHGLEIAEFLSNGKLVNGLGMDSKITLFNGAGCLAAQLIHHLKDGPGGLYVTDLRHGAEEYDYVITVRSPWIKGEKYDIEITCKHGKKKLFSGSPQEFIECQKLNLVD